MSPAFTYFMVFAFLSLAAPSLLRRSSRLGEAGSSFVDSGAVCRRFGGGDVDGDDFNDVLIESVEDRFTAVDGNQTRLCIRARGG